MLHLDHVALPIFDVAASHRFYAEVLALPLVGALSGDDWEGHPWLMMQFGLADARQLVLVALRGTTRTRESLPRDVRHVAMAVADTTELETMRRRLDAATIAYRREDHGAQQSLYFEDPNGIVLEVTAPPTAVALVDIDAAATVRAWLAG